MKRSLCIISLLLFAAVLLNACGEIPSETSSETGSTASVHTVSSVPPIPLNESSASGNSSAGSSSAGVPIVSEPETTSSEPSTKPTSEPPAVSEPVVSSEEPSKDPHMVNGFLVNGTRGMELFGGSAKGGAMMAESLNQFKSSVGSNVRVYAMPITLPCAFYAPAGYENAINATKNCFYGLRDALNGVEFVDVYAALLPHKDEEIYARTDHHWFALGAYYASEALCKQANATFAPLSEYETKQFDGFLGSTVTAFKVDELRKYPETFVWYEPKQQSTAHYYSQDYKLSFTGTVFSKSNSYMKFIYGDGYAVRIETGVKNGRKMLVIKDSYGNALAPFLTYGFEEVYFIDIREFKCNVPQFIQENQITDVTFALSAFGVAGSANRKNIERLLTQ